MNFLLESPVELGLDACVGEDIRLAEDLEKVVDSQGLGKLKLESVFDGLSRLKQNQLQQREESLLVEDGQLEGV